MSRLKTSVSALIFTAAALSAALVHATVTIDMVTIGDPGNAAYDGARRLRLRQRPRRGRL